MKTIAIILMLATIAAAYDFHPETCNKMFQKIGTFKSSVNGVEKIKTYYVSRTVKLYWAHALMFCQSFGMQLVELPTAEEARLFTRKCADYAEYFDQAAHIGGTSIGNGLYRWYWLSTGQPVDYHLEMYPGEPNNHRGLQNCLSLDKAPGSFKFNDINPYGIHEEKFVCEHEGTANIHY